MERFIVDIFIQCQISTDNLKSSMERFIVCTVNLVGYMQKDLKSSMERFIVEFFLLATKKSLI